MTGRDLPIHVTTEGGKLRADIPATSIEAEDVEGLMNQVDLVMQDIKSALRTRAVDDLEDQALREVDAKALRREALERLATRYPPPPEWFDEPE